MREALLQVKEELGPEALILRTQKIKGSLLGGSERWEVTAGLEDRFFEKPTDSVSLAPAPPAPTPSYGPGTRRISVPPANPIEPPTSRLSTSPTPLRETTQISRDEFRALQDGIESVRRAAEAPTQAIQAVRQDLGQLRSVVSLLADHWKEQPGGLPVSAPVLPWYQQLLKSDFAEDLARETCEEAALMIRETGRDDPAWCRTVVLRALASRMPCAPLRFAKGRGTSRLLFAGPTGVGKTTTMMKLAVRLSRQDGLSVGVVGCDSYRIGAQEQIKTFCDVAGLPLRIVFTDADLETALQDLSDMDVVLIDTAGRSPANQVHFLELSTLVERIRPSDLILVQSATTRLRDLTASVRAYRDLGPSRLVFTKIDESQTHGAMCTLASRERIPVTALCFGQEIPEAMSEAAPDELARMLLGDEGGEPA